MFSLQDTSIQKKITWVIMVTTVASLLLALGTLFIFELRQLRVSLARELESIAQIVGSNVTAALEFDDRKAGLQVLYALDKDPRVITAGVYDDNSRLFAAYTRAGDADPLPSLLPPKWPLLPSIITIIHPIELGDTSIGTVVIQATPKEAWSRLLEYSLILLSALVIASVAAYILSWRLRNLISAPILYLASMASRVSRESDYSIRAIKTSNDETGILVDQFNAMLDQIGKNSAALRETSRLVKDSEHQLLLITNALPLLISYLDGDGRYKFVNKAHEQWFGIPVSDLIGKKPDIILGAEAYKKARPYIKRVLKGEQVSYELEVSVPKKGARSISKNYVPDLSDEGEVRGYFAMGIDLTDQKNAELELRILNEALEQRVKERTAALERSQEQVRRSERLASIGTLAAGIAHEIRNPLNSIYLAAQYALRKKNSLEDSIRIALESIGSEAVRCGSIIKNVLLFAKSERTEKTPHDLNNVVRHAIDLADTYVKSKFSLSLSMDEEPLFVVMNPTEIEQVIVNVINNAVEASKNGAAKIEIVTRKDSGRAILSIKDDGQGIPPDVITHIFDPFFSTKRHQGNTGLGLSLCHGIITEHRGLMTVESSVGEGTIFKIDLPNVEQAEMEHGKENTVS